MPSSSWAGRRLMYEVEALADGEEQSPQRDVIGDAGKPTAPR